MTVCARCGSQVHQTAPIGVPTPMSIASTEMWSTSSRRICLICVQRFSEWWTQETAKLLEEYGD